MINLPLKLSVIEDLKLPENKEFLNQTVATILGKKYTIVNGQCVVTEPIKEYKLKGKFRDKTHNYIFNPTTDLEQAEKITRNYKADCFYLNRNWDTEYIIYNKSDYFNEYHKHNTYTAECLPNRFIINKSAAIGRCLLYVYRWHISKGFIPDVLFTNMVNHPPYKLEEHSSRLILDDPIAKAYNWLRDFISHYGINLVHLISIIIFNTYSIEININYLTKKVLKEYPLRGIRMDSRTVDLLYYNLEIYLNKPNGTFYRHNIFG